MSFLRRKSSRKETDGKSEDDHHAGRPSLVQRLSRRGSREHVKEATLSTEVVKSEHEPAPQSVLSLPPNLTIEIPNNDETPANGLTKEDVQALFFGAPHFMLEKGRHGKAFPQAFFPWNTDLEVSDLQDRRYIKHESFVMVTLHAHLPIPDEMKWSPSSLPQKREDPWKRPMLDLGIFETPNMLALQGREPGTVGLRFFLEVPISERLRTIEKAKEEERGYGSSLTNMSANEAFKKEAGKPQTGKHAPRQDRLKLIDDGPRAWERLGIRNVESSTIISRMSYLCQLHDEVLQHGLGDTILHKQSCATLYDELFNKLLYPPAKPSADGIDKHHRAALKVQIEALVKILTTPGAWVDFSLVEPRIRLGQGLWQVPPYDDQSSDATSLKPGAERKWLLLQILLSMELMVRLDAALRLGSSDSFREFHLTPEEIHQFNKMRNLKVDWDLVVARRFLDLVLVKQVSDFDIHQFMQDKRAPQSHLTSTFKNKMDLHAAEDDLSIWKCAIFPRRAEIQFEGLLRFARIIDWPNVDDLEAKLTERYRTSATLQNDLYTQPIKSTGRDPGIRQVASTPMRSLFSGDKWVEKASVNLRPVSGMELGGFLGRTWLLGLIMPGEAGCLSVMACLLEQDRQAAKLGTIAYLHGGFILNGRSFWNKACIVGRVLASAPGSTECMGWINIPQVPPFDENKVAYSDTWLDVTASSPPATREGLRIYDGPKLADDSNVLGAGRGKVRSSEYVLITDKVLEDLAPVEVQMGALILRKNSLSGSQESTLFATLTFKTSIAALGPARREFRLDYTVGFVSSYPCRTPHGHLAESAEKKHQRSHHQANEHLPSHPLHNTYKFETKSIADLINASPPKAGRNSAVWIVDARGPPEKDIFVRAWCAQVGQNAIVSRVGKCCLACSIREAFALEIAIIIRVEDIVRKGQTLSGEQNEMSAAQPRAS